MNCRRATKPFLQPALLDTKFFMVISKTISIQWILCWTLVFRVSIRVRFQIKVRDIFMVRVKYRVMVEMVIRVLYINTVASNRKKSFSNIYGSFICTERDVAPQ